MKNVRVAVFRPGQETSFELVRNDLQSQQALVGGFIEMVRITEQLAVICNEDGKLLHLPMNRVLMRAPTVAERHEKGLALWVDALVGTFFVTRTAGSGIRDLTPADEELLKAWKPDTAWDLDLRKAGKAIR